LIQALRVDATTRGGRSATTAMNSTSRSPPSELTVRTSSAGSAVISTAYVTAFIRSSAR